MSQPAFERKRCPPGELAARVARLPRPRVFTNGCFDILHRGHVAEARALGASLIVGVNSDASVEAPGQGRGPSGQPARRPHGATRRTGIGVAGRRVRRRHAARSDPRHIVGAAEVTGWGGSVHSIPFQRATSTTALLGKIRAC